MAGIPIVRPRRGRNESLTNIASQSGGITHADLPDCLEGADHTADRAKQPDHRRDRPATTLR
jgi:hypothetical protein